MTSTQLRILILEDDELLQRSFVRVLRHRGHEVAVASTISEFRQRIAGPALPDVVLLDHALVGEIGWSVRNEVPQGVRVLLMSGAPPKDAPPHLMKPIDNTTLFDAVEGRV